MRNKRKHVLIEDKYPRLWKAAQIGITINKLKLINICDFHWKILNWIEDKDK